MNGQIQYGTVQSATSPATQATRAHHRLADPGRFRVARDSRRWTASVVVGAVFVMLLIAVPQLPEGPVLLLGGIWVSLMLAMTLPSRAQRAGDELAARLARFRHAVNSIGDAPTRDLLEDVLGLARELDLRDDEIPDDLARVRASLSALALLGEISGGRLPVVTTESTLTSGDSCHFVAPARLGRRRSDQYGQVLMTTHWLKFSGAADLSVAWVQIDDVQRAGADLVITTADRRRDTRFAFNSVEEAARAGVIARHLRELAQADASAEREQRAFSAMM